MDGKTRPGKKKKKNIPNNFHLAHSDFPWAFFLFQFCNSCLFSVKLTPSVSDSFTLNSSADSFVREKKIPDVPLAFDYGIGVCRECQDEVACGKLQSSRWSGFRLLPLRMSLCCFLFVLGSSGGLPNDFLIGIRHRSFPLCWLHFSCRKHTHISLILKHKEAKSPLRKDHKPQFPFPPRIHPQTHFHTSISEVRTLVHHLCFSPHAAIMDLLLRYPTETL